MIRLKIRDTFHRLIDGYEINESSREVKFSDLKLDFTDKTIADLPLKYQECQLVDVDLEDIEQSSGYTIDGVNIRLNYDDKRNFSYRLEGNTSQSGTPTPTSPVAVDTVTGRQEISVASKNLANIENAQVGKSWNNSTNNQRATIMYIPIQKNKQYTLASSWTNSNITNIRAVFNYGSSDTVNNTVPSSYPYNNTQYDYVSIEIIANTTFTSSMLQGVKILLCEGSATIDDYDIYRGKTYEINLGKNLLNIDGTRTSEGLTNTTTGTTISVSGTSSNTYSSLTQQITQNIPIGTYTFSIQETYNKRIGFIATFSDNTNTTYNITANQLSTTFTTTKEIKSYRLYMETVSGTIYNMTIKPQLEKGSVASSFSPYKTPIELNNVDGYKDIIFKNGVDSDYYDSSLEEGAWYLHKEIGRYDFTGTETWTRNTYGTNSWYITNLVNAMYIDTTKTIMSNIFYGVSNSERASSYTNKIYLDQWNNTSIRDTTLTTNAEVQNATKGNYIYYVLATPPTTKIEDEELVSQLEAVKLKNGLNEISSELFEVSPILHFWYNFNEAYTWSRINEIIYTGYVNNFVLPSMKNKKEYRELELELELLSPLAMATLRTVDVSGRYNLKDAITNILQPLIDDGFNLVQMNIYDVPVNVNYLAETIESAMNKLSNNYNFWWYIDKNKNIYINSIGSLLAKQPLLSYTDNIKLDGLIDFTPRTNATDYCNTVCFSNVRIYRKSYYEKNYNYSQEQQAYELWGYDLYYPLVDNIYKIKDDDTIEFNHPIDLYPQRTLGLESVYGKDILEIYNITNYTTNLLARIHYDGTGHLTYSDNISIDGSDNTKAFQIILGGDNDNLITGFKYNGTDFELGEIISDFALPLLKVRFVDNIEINKNKNIINESGIVEKLIDMNERITTYDNLLNIANAIMRKNTSNVEEIEIKSDGDLEFEVGNIISVDRSSFLTKGKFIIIDKKIIYGDNVRNCIYTLRNTRILENYVDLFRASETYEEEEQEKTYIITANVVKEEIKESYEVENES